VKPNFNAGRPNQADVRRIYFRPTRNFYGNARGGCDKHFPAALNVNAIHRLLLLRATAGRVP
jgi:hypothetical protein